MYCCGSGFLLPQHWHIQVEDFAFPHNVCVQKLPFFFLAEEESGAVEPAVERAAIGKWIDAMGRWIDLKNKDTGIRPDKSVPRAPAGELGDSFFWKEV